MLTENPFLLAATCGKPPEPNATLNTAEFKDCGDCGCTCDSYPNGTKVEYQCKGDQRHRLGDIFIQCVNGLWKSGLAVTHNIMDENQTLLKAKPLECCKYCCTYPDTLTTLRWTKRDASFMKNDDKYGLFYIYN